LVGLRAVRFGPGLAILLVLLAPAPSYAIDLKPETVQAWDDYTHAAQMRTQERASGQRPFLWSDEKEDLAPRLRGGEIWTEAVGERSPHPIPHGLIHDWIGAAFVPKAKLESVIEVLDDYQHYKDFYRSMIAKASVIGQTPDDEKVTVLMVHKAYGVTAAVETDDDVHFKRLDVDRACSSTISSHVREMADYGKPTEHAFPEGQGPGYVWRTYFVTRLQQRDDGVYVEMEMMGLSRSIPLAFRWLVQPLAERLPRDILLETLKDTREAVLEKTK
jgi:hypothetical protein